MADKSIPEGMVAEAETPIDRLLRLMKRASRRAFANDTGDLLGMGQIKQMMGTKDSDAIRGYLIKLVARGEVEVLECTNGVYWRARVERKSPEQILAEEAEGHFVLQREVTDDPRGLWFDAEIFTNSKRAAAALQWARWEAQARAQQWSGPTERVQRIRLISMVQA